MADQDDERQKKNLADKPSVEEAPPAPPATAGVGGGHPISSGQNPGGASPVGGSSDGGVPTGSVKCGDR